VAFAVRESERLASGCAAHGRHPFVAWAPINGMPTWLDDEITLMSVATLIAFRRHHLGILSKRRLAAAGATAIAFASDGPEAESAAAGKIRTKRARIHGRRRGR